MPLTLPLIPSLAFYSFDTTLFGSIFQFNISWNDADQSWYMDLATDLGSPIASGLRLVLGAMIGSRFHSTDAPTGFFFVIDTSGKGQEATFDDMGTRVLVKFFHTTEVDLFLSLGIPIQ